MDIFAQSPDTALFETYQQTAAQRRVLTAKLQGDEGGLADERLEQAFAIGVARLDERMQQYEEQPGRLVNGAVLVGEGAVSALKQIPVLEGVLTPEEIDELRDPYRDTIINVLGFLASRTEVSDSRIERLREAAHTLGGVILKDEVKTGPEEVEAIKPDSISERSAQSLESGAEDPGILLVLKRAAVVPLGQTEKLRPAELFQFATGQHYDSRVFGSRKALQTLIANANNYRSINNDQVVEFNGRAGRAARYILNPVDPETLATAFNRTFSVGDALTLATFFRMYSDALSHKKAPTLDGAVLDKLLEAVPETSLPQTQETVIASRTQAFETLKRLLGNSQLAEQLDGLVNADDPRHQLLEYIQQIATPDIIALLDRLAKSYKELTFSMVVDRKIGGLTLHSVTAAANGEDGHMELSASDRRIPSGPDLSRTAAEEHAETETPQAKLTGYTVGWAEVAQRHGLTLDRPYSLQRLTGIFEELGPLLEDRTATMTVAEAVVLMASKTPEFGHFSDPNQSVAAINKALQRKMSSE